MLRVIRQSILNGRRLRDYTASVLRADAKNYSNPAEFLKRNAYFFSPPKLKEATEENAKAVHLQFDILRRASHNFSKISDACWGEKSLAEQVEELITSSGSVQRDLKSSKVDLDIYPVTKSSLHQQLRTVVTGGLPGPGMLEILSILGRTATLKRLEEGLQENSK
jgi:glutamyl-tRNA synthetase